MLDLPNLQFAITRLGLNWRAGTTVNSNQSELEALSRLGAVPPEGTTLAVREELARTRIGILGQPSGGIPTAWDWRSVNGSDFVTPIKDQGGCGSCVAFGTVATFETQVQIKLGDAAAGVDLSEANLWFCYGPKNGAGACPNGGWWPDSSFPGLIPGIVPAASFPYTADAQPCSLCGDSPTKLTAITSWEKITDPTTMKAFISQNGPMTACFTIYEDFYYHYVSGIYEYNAETSGNVIGGHCISIVGYSDAGQYWIAKNSWGPNWGESGFFRIGYGQCGIDSEMWGINGSIVSEVWPLPDNGFNLLPGAANDIGVGANGSVWVIGNNAVSGGFGIFEFASYSTWVEFPGSAVRISVGPDGTPWVVNSDHQIFHWNGATWDLFPGAANAIGGTWNLLPGDATDIGVGADGSVWVIGTSVVPGGFGIYQWNGNGWTQVSGGAVRVAVAPDGSPWVVNSDHQIFRRSGTNWDLLPGSATDVGVGADGSVWVIGTDAVPGGFGIFEWNGSGWAQVPGGAVEIAVGPQGSPWVVNAGNQIFQG